MYTANQLRSLSKDISKLKDLRDAVVERARFDAENGYTMSSYFIYYDALPSFKSFNHEKLLKLFLKLGYFAEIRLYDIEDSEGCLGEVVLRWEDENLNSRGIIKKGDKKIIYTLVTNTEGELVLI